MTRKSQRIAKRERNESERRKTVLAAKIDEKCGIIDEGSKKRKREITAESSHNYMTRSKRRKIDLMNSEKINSIDDEDKHSKRKRLVIILTRLTDADLKKAGVHRKNYTEKITPKKLTKKRKIDDLAFVEVQSEFFLNEIIWAKIKGSLHWPAKIESIVESNRGCRKYVVVWYNDYRRSVVFKSQLYKLLENFEKFAVKFNDVIGLKTAAFEAMFEYRQNMIRK